MTFDFLLNAAADGKNGIGMGIFFIFLVGFIAFGLVIDQAIKIHKELKRRKGEKKNENS